MKVKKFNPLVVASSFFNCSLPLNMDTYRYCPYQCEYCFMKNRVVGKGNLEKIPNIHWVKHKFKKVYDDKNINPSNFIEVLLKNRVDIHCGTKSEPFQPIEKKKQYTKKIIDICNEYNQHILFTTKSDTYHDVNLNPDYHTFQLSVTNHYNDRYLEPNVPSLDKRIHFYNQLKDEGFKVGIRIAPFIKNITKIDKILDLFKDVDFVNISRLRLIPHCKNDKFMNYIGADKTEYTTRGVTMMKLDVAYSYLKPYFDYLDDNNYSWSCGFLNEGNNDCCCGDNLVNNCVKWDPLHLKHKFNNQYSWSLEDGLTDIGEYKDCVCSQLYTSNRRNGNRTVEDFYRDRWDNANCTFNPKNKFNPPVNLDDY